MDHGRRFAQSRPDRRGIEIHTSIPHRVEHLLHWRFHESTPTCLYKRKRERKRLIFIWDSGGKKQRVGVFVKGQTRARHEDSPKGGEFRACWGARSRATMGMKMGGTRRGFAKGQIREGANSSQA
ncbi:hypothetical protein SBA3_820004 [Candidatus Sulfopaludibacter sp. SbA3]|nr:hypothetical protein SBA3_820004 [Candidatus Sulfopaludibacter sp. SbA3]